MGVVLEVSSPADDVVVEPAAVARLPRAAAFRLDALPLRIAGGVLTVAVTDPADERVLDELRAAARLRVRTCAMPRLHIRARLYAAYGGAPAEARARDHDDAPAVRALDEVLQRAVAAHASDVHVEPAAAGGGRVRCRIDGILREPEPIAAEIFTAFCSRLKLIAGMDIADRRQPQDGRCAIAFDGREIDARVASVPTLDGEKLVVRLLDRHAAAPTLAGLGMPDTILPRFRGAIHAPCGLVVVAGPTGSGKTTTLYAALGEIDATSRNVCSVEDPVEMRVPGVSQVQVNVRAGLTFPAVVRAFMRQDPNVVMVGEMRDAETAAVAVAAALAGQTVFATLHANDAPRTVDRLVELGVARHALAAALTAVVAQRLVRLLCESCRAVETIPPELREAQAGLQQRWHVARGCRACGGSGYLGRTGVYELLDVDEAVREAIAGGASSVHVAQLGARNGYEPMRSEGMRKVLSGATSFAELRRVVAWSAR
jgi:type IV pilus assembly protein PilB